MLHPVPDMSGVSSWTAPLPDIALHTMADSSHAGPGGHHPFSWTEVETPDTVPTKQIILQARASHKRVNLNVGGIKHEVMWRMLEQYQDSRLGKLTKVESHEEIMELCTDYSLVNNEYFFDRHPRSFNSILNFYRTGKLHVNEEMCVLTFQNDLQYWGLPDTLMESCCKAKYESDLLHVLQVGKSFDKVNKATTNVSGNGGSVF